MSKNRYWAAPIILAIALAAALSGCKSDKTEETIQWTKASGKEESPSPDEDPGQDVSSGADSSAGSTTAPQTTSAAVPGADQDYLLPDSSISYLTADDLSHLTPSQYRLARNEIYARHGRKFNSQDLQSYFDSKSWYQGTVEAADFKESSLSDCEKANIRLLQSMEPVAGLENLPEAPSKKVIDRYGYSSGYSVLSFNITPGTAKDCGSYYLVDAVYNQAIQAPGDLNPGDTVTLVFNELTGETKTLAYGSNGLYDAAYGQSGSAEYYYSPSADGSPVTLYQDSDDRVDKPIYKGSLYIRKDATIEQAIVSLSEPVTLAKLQGEFNWYNGVYFDQKGYVTRLVFYGD